MCHFQDRTTFRLARSREFNGSSAKCSRKCRTRAAAPWSLNGSKSVVEVAPISYPSGKCNFNVFLGSYPYPYLLPGIRIFRISRESHRSQGGDAQSSSPIESSRRCDDFKFEFGYFSLTDFSPASTILKVIVLRVALCNMRKNRIFR